jgi:hypothetical protein
MTKRALRGREKARFVNLDDAPMAGVIPVPPRGLPKTIATPSNKQR